MLGFVVQKWHHMAWQNVHHNVPLHHNIAPFPTTWQTTPQTTWQNVHPPLHRTHHHNIAYHGKCTHTPYVRATLAVAPSTTTSPPSPRRGKKKKDPRPTGAGVFYSKIPSNLSYTSVLDTTNVMVIRIKASCHGGAADVGGVVVDVIVIIVALVDGGPPVAFRVD